MHGLHSPVAPTERGLTLHTFSAEASAAWPGPDWLRERRAAGYEAFASTPLPSESEEVWRYTPIDELALDEFAPAAPTRRARRRVGRGRTCWLRSGTSWARRPGACSVPDGQPGAFAVAHGHARASFAFGRADDVAGVARHAGVGPARRRRAGAA